MLDPGAKDLVCWHVICKHIHSDRVTLFEEAPKILILDWSNLGRLRGNQVLDLVPFNLSCLMLPAATSEYLHVTSLLDIYDQVINIDWSKGLLFNSLYLLVIQINAIY